jgi:hypothetical protein
MKDWRPPSYIITEALAYKICHNFYNVEEEDGVEVDQ